MIIAYTKKPSSDEEGGTSIASDGRRENNCVNQIFLSLSQKQVLTAPSSEGATNRLWAIRASFMLWRSNSVEKPCQSINLSLFRPPF